VFDPPWGHAQLTKLFASSMEEQGRGERAFRDAPESARDQGAECGADCLDKDYLAAWQSGRCQVQALPGTALCMFRFPQLS
jgi:hypothetical protein